jgi:LysM repeat protein
MRKRLIVSILVVMALSLACPAMAQGSVIHVVQRGENLTRIAARYRTTPQAIAAANGLANLNFVWVGQRLRIPSGSSGAPSYSATYVVQRGDTLARIAARHGTTIRALAAANGITNINFVWVGQRLRVPSGYSTPSSGGTASGGTSYRVRRGDTLTAIAARHGVSMWTLARYNGISNPSRIYVGQVIRIPGGSAPSQPSAPSGGTGGRWIDVNLSAQRITAYQGNTAVRSSLVSTGLPRTPTPTGRFYIQRKYASVAMSGPGYYLPAVPYSMFFYAGYAIHGTYWHSNFGRPMSHGCINLPTGEAAWFYSFAPIGTPVYIHY